MEERGLNVRSPFLLGEFLPSLRADILGVSASLGGRVAGAGERLLAQVLFCL